MKAGIIAAGRGQRLRATNHLKPLVRLRNRTLIEHVLHSIAQVDATEVVIIINEDSIAVRDYVRALRWPFTLQWIVETTCSSMHSFLRVLETLSAEGDDGPFLISTVDTIADEKSYAHFVAEAKRHEDAAITLALTSRGDDENPLLVRLAENNSDVAAIGDAAASSEFATAGVYFVRSSILAEAEGARRDGVDALRKFLARLLERGYRIDGISITKSIDVDRPTDIETAEEFLRAIQT
jgi:NDP-sugar pyrophosphorylase family protein